MKRHIPWFGAGAIIILLFGTVYAAVQQAQRSAADNPQIKLASDAAVALDSGKSPESITGGSVSINESLAPFVVVYDKNGKPVSGSGKLDNHLPTIPIGVLTSAKGQDYNAISWQPQANVRIAAVTVAAEKYYVLSGRSLKEVEKAEERTFQLSSIGCLGSLVILIITYATSRSRARK